MTHQQQRRGVEREMVRIRGHIALVAAVALGLVLPVAAAIGPANSTITNRRMAPIDGRERARLAVQALEARIALAEADARGGERRLLRIEQARKGQRARLAARQGRLVHLVAAIETLSRRPAALALAQPGSINDVAHVRALLAAAAPEIRRRTAGVRIEIVRGEQLAREADRALIGLRRTQLLLIERREELARMEASLAGGGPPSPREAMRALALGERARDALDMIRDIDDRQAVEAALVSLPGPLLRPDMAARDDFSFSLVGLLARNQAPPRRLAAYLLPVDGPVVTGLGEVSSAGVRARGISLLGLPRAAVIAPNRGRVAYAGSFRSYGQIVVIDHGRRWYSLITGMAALYVQAGDELTRGQVIGRLGEGQPKVTVELRRAGLPIDLTPLLRRG